MIRNILRLGMRLIARNASNSIVNLAGLVTGMACFLAISFYIYAEWSYDRHFTNSDRVYRIGISFFNIGNFAIGPEAIGEYVPQDVPSVERITRIFPDGSARLEVEGKSFDKLVYFSDSSFFKIFSYSFVEGDAATALHGPADAILTRSEAIALFGTAQAIGKTLLAGKEKTPYTVTGIVADDPRSSQFKTGIWLSNKQKLSGDFTWTSASCYNFALVRESSTEADLMQGLDRLLEKRVFPQASGVPQGLTFEQYKAHANSVKFLVHPLTDIHLYSQLNYELAPVVSSTNLIIFAGIAVLILMLASINFINLTMAQGVRRSREVGVRKSLGAARTGLIGQFVLESVGQSIMVLPLALVGAWLLIKWFEVISEQTLQPAIWMNAVAIGGMFLFALVVGVLAGLYPAIVLTSFRPALALKGIDSGGRPGRLRDVLVVAQLAIAAGLLIVTGVVINQVRFMKKKDLGFDQNQILSLNRIDKLGESADAFCKEVATLTGVETVSQYSGEPGNKSVMSISTFKVPGQENDATVSVYYGDEHYLDLMGYRLKEGRGITDSDAEGNSVILNESAVKMLGLTNPIGATVNEKQTVVGVVYDFHWESLRTQIAPLAIMTKAKYYQAGVKLNGNSKDLISAVEAKWKAFSDEPFSYHFVDENFGKMMKQEEQIESGIVFFTLVAVFISCLGLYGLAALTTIQRTREIGIRKALGAGVWDILTLLSRRLLMLVVLACAIAVPVAWWLSRDWLQSFAYKVEPGVGLMIAAVLTCLITAWLSISFHTLRATRLNPASTLKHE